MDNLEGKNEVREMTTDEALEYISSDIRFQEPTCIEDVLRGIEALNIIKKCIEKGME